MWQLALASFGPAPKDVNMGKQSARQEGKRKVKHTGSGAVVSHPRTKVGRIDAAHERVAPRPSHSTRVPDPITVESRKTTIRIMRREQAARAQED